MTLGTNCFASRLKNAPICFFLSCDVLIISNIFYFCSRIQQSNYLVEISVLLLLFIQNSEDDRRRKRTTTNLNVARRLAFLAILGLRIWWTKFIKNGGKTKYREVIARVQAKYEISFNGNYQSNHSSFLNRLVYAFITIICLKMHVNVGICELKLCLGVYFPYKTWFW